MLLSPCLFVSFCFYGSGSQPHHGSLRGVSVFVIETDRYILAVIRWELGCQSADTLQLHVLTGESQVVGILHGQSDAPVYGVEPKIRIWI